MWCEHEVERCQLGGVHVFAKPGHSDRANGGGGQVNVGISEGKGAEPGKLSFESSFPVLFVRGWWTEPGQWIVLGGRDGSSVEQGKGDEFWAGFEDVR